MKQSPVQPPPEFSARPMNLEMEMESHGCVSVNEEANSARKLRVNHCGIGP